MRNHMRSIKALGIFVLLSGCGTTQDEETQIDDRLRPVLAQWAQDCRGELDGSDQVAKCNTLGIESITLVKEIAGDEGILGQCNIKWHGLNLVRTIVVRDDIPLGSFYMRAVFAHEMMHCRFGIYAHSRGLMAEHMPYGEATLEAKWPELLRELYDLIR
jgi:hypothetical protein